MLKERVAIRQTEEAAGRAASGKRPAPGQCAYHPTVPVSLAGWEQIRRPHGGTMPPLKRRAFS